MKTVSITAVCLCAALLAGRGEAADGNAYVGASVGLVDVDTAFRPNRGSTNAYDTDDVGLKVFAGYRLSDWFGIEGGYLDLGDVVQVAQFPDASNLRLNQKAIDVFGVFSLQAEKFELFAKAGVVRSNVDGSFSSLFGPTGISDKETDVAWGIGAARTLDDFAIRVEYERFGFESFYGDFRHPELLSVGFTWTFH